VLFRKTTRTKEAKYMDVRTDAELNNCFSCSHRRVIAVSDSAQNVDVWLERQ